MTFLAGDTVLIVESTADASGDAAFDGLIDWDFTRPDQIAALTPGLAA